MLGYSILYTNRELKITTLYLLSYNYFMQTILLSLYQFITYNNIILYMQLGYI